MAIIGRIRRIPKREQIEIAPIFIAAARSELDIDLVLNEDSDRPLIDLILQILKQGADNGWPLVKLLIELLMSFI